MKLFLLSMVLLSRFAIAGGIYCKECPPETEKCLPKKCTNTLSPVDMYDLTFLKNDVESEHLTIVNIEVPTLCV